MKAIIIDDEQRARHLLQSILEQHCPLITEIHCASNLPEGVGMIRAHQPQVVFLDVEMPGYAGTQILDFFQNERITFQIIFTTAYDDYALKAFQLNAISYLLKPLRISQVQEAVERAGVMLKSQHADDQINALKRSLASEELTKIGVPVSDGVQYVNISDIRFFKADGMYTGIHVGEQEPIIISKPLKYFEAILAEHPAFVRTHRSYLVHKVHIAKISRGDGGKITLNDGQEVSITKEKLEQLISSQGL